MYWLLHVVRLMNSMEMNRFAPPDRSQNRLAISYPNFSFSFRFSNDVGEISSLVFLPYDEECDCCSQSLPVCKWGYLKSAAITRDCKISGTAVFHHFNDEPSKHNLYRLLEAVSIVAQGGPLFKHRIYKLGVLCVTIAPRAVWSHDKWLFSLC